MNRPQRIYEDTVIKEMTTGRYASSHPTTPNIAATLTLGLSGGRSSSTRICRCVSRVSSVLVLGLAHPGVKAFAVVGGLGAGLVVCLAPAVLLAAVAAGWCRRRADGLREHEIPEPLLGRYERAPACRGWPWGCRGRWWPRSDIPLIMFCHTFVAATVARAGTTRRCPRPNGPN